MCIRDRPEWEVNRGFANDVLREAKNRELPVVLICRSGTRSVDAGKVLEAAGFADVTNVLYGFEGELDAEHHRGRVNGWRHDGLPWEQM